MKVRFHSVSKTKRLRHKIFSAVDFLIEETIGVHDVTGDWDSENKICVFTLVGRPEQIRYLSKTRVRNLVLRLDREFWLKQNFRVEIRRG